MLTELTKNILKALVAEHERLLREFFIRSIRGFYYVIYDEKYNVYIILGAEWANVEKWSLAAWRSETINALR